MFSLINKKDVYPHNHLELNSLMDELPNIHLILIT